MKRLVPVVAALTLIAAACSGGDDSASDTSEVSSDDTAEVSADDATSTDEPTADTGDDTTTTLADDPATDDTADTDDLADEAADDDTGDDDTATDSDDGGNVVMVRSIDDVPPACQDEMAEFLRALEPIVSTIDWQAATMADFERIANEFQEEADAFEAASGDAGCGDLEFDEENEGEVLLDFARREAPGAVGFLEFLDEIRTSATPGDDGTPGDSEIQTCQDAIDFLQGLMDDYGSMSEVPAAELMKIPSIAGLYAECTPEQLEFFDNADLELFMGG